MPSRPAVEPVPTATEQVNVVPLALARQAFTTAASTVAPVPTNAWTVENGPKPVPVTVIVTGTEPEVPGTIGALGDSATAEIVAVSFETTPIPRMPAFAKVSPLPPVLTTWTPQRPVVPVVATWKEMFGRAEQNRRTRYERSGGGTSSTRQGQGEPRLESSTEDVNRRCRGSKSRNLSRTCAVKGRAIDR